VNRIGLGKPVLLVVLFALPVFLDLYEAHVAVLILVFAIVAIGLSLVMGFGGQVNLAQAAFFGAGAYTSAILTSVFGWNPWLAAPVAIAATCAVALIVGIPALRIQSHYLGIVSLGLAIAFTNLLTNATITGGASGMTQIPPLPIPGLDMTDEYNYYYLTLVVLIAVFAFSMFIARTTLGRRFRAMRDDNLAAAAAGIEIPVYRMQAFLLAGLLCGVAGVLYAHLVRYVSPDTFGLPAMFLLLGMVIIGGQDSIWGAVVGAVLLISARNLLTGIQTYQQLIYGGLIVATVVFAPRGLAGAAASVRHRLPFPWPSIPIPLPRSAMVQEAPVLEMVRPTAGRGVDTVALKVERMSKRFRGVKALTDVAITVDACEIHGIIGPNGSGKTTLFNCISGIYRPNTGQVWLWGRDVTARRAYRMSRLGVARTFQNLRLFRQLTVLDNVMVAIDRDPAWVHVRYLLAPWLVIRSERDRRIRAMAILRQFELEGVAGELAINLPYGRQRQLEIARAIAAQPTVLLLDEPAAGLNAAEQEGLKQTIKRIRDGGITVIVIEHNMGLVMTVCEKITVLAHGRVIAQGSPAEVARDAQVIEAYLGQETPNAEAV
jgi:branched-chain amino acid transport system permease protein